MFKSIRWTLQLWHAAILFFALAAFGTVLYLAAERTAYTEIDAELSAAARVLATPHSTDFKPLPVSPGSSNSLQLAMASPAASDVQQGAASDATPASAEVLRSSGAMRPPARVWAREIPQDCLRRIGWTEAEQPYFIIWGPGGIILRNSVHCPVISAARVELVGAVQPGIGAANAQFRQRGSLREVMLAGPLGSTILVGRSMQREIDMLASLRLSLTAAGAMVMIVGLLGGSALSRRVLHPIERISETARSISASDLTRRIDPQETRSELGSLARTLNDTFDRLELAFRRQAQFTADASHELRTPLAIISSGSELALKRQRTADEYRQTLESNLRASRRMQSLVESLLVLARSDADALDLHPARINLRSVVEDCVNLLTPVATKRGIRMSMSGSNVELDADSDRMVQLVTNLIGNAIQYNRDGGTVSVSTARDGDDALIVVSDTGIGISREDQPRVFERFFRAEGARTRERGGSGLGLAICQGIARAHGGKISFTSDPMVGTTFTVRLPIACGRTDTFDSAKENP